MNGNHKLYKQIEDLNNKIKKLESVVLNKKQTQLFTNNKNTLKSSNTSKSSLDTYRIHFPKESYSNKKYIGLKFDNNFVDNDLNEISYDKNLLSFIKLIKSNIIINYSIQLELNYTPITPIYCSIAIGIKTSSYSKIKIIRGTKYNFDLSSNTIDNMIIITNNILYSAEEGEELCIIVDFDFASGSCSDSHCTLNSKKSIIKILYV